MPESFGINFAIHFESFKRCKNNIIVIRTVRFRLSNRSDSDYKKLKWLHERERPRKSKKLSLWDQRLLKAKTFSVLLTSTPHSTIPSSMLPISPERKPWSVLPVV